MVRRGGEGWERSMGRGGRMGVEVRGGKGAWGGEGGWLFTFI